MPLEDVTKSPEQFYDVTPGAIGRNGLFPENLGNHRSTFIFE